MTELDKIRAAILQRFGSIHAFCALHANLNRTTVYAILNGRYAGNTSKQLGRIAAALDGDKANSNLPSLEEISAAIREVACKKCPINKHHDLCERCTELHVDQAKAALAVFERHINGELS